MSVSLKFLGGVGTVTGSSHLVKAERSQVLLDAGLFQGRRDESYKINTTFNYNPHTIDALVLSHAHIDHCGNIPSVIKQGLRCKIYTTSATKDLAKLMLEDAGKIQEEDIRYVNKINKRLGLPLRKPLYTKKEAEKCTRTFRSIAYGQKFCLAPQISVTLYDAGHILGSSIAVLDIKTDNKNLRLGYAVDLGRKNLPLLDDPVPPKDLDYLVLETTYGARCHSPIEEAKVKLHDVVNRTFGRGGKIIIPAFTLERTQEVVYFLNELLKEKTIPAIPIYVDSPLATDITGIFERHADYLDLETRRQIEDKHSPFDFANLKYIRLQEESKKLNEDRRPMIIIAGSGMCESGRVLHHLKNNIEDSRNTILVVGFMARDTLGRKIVEHVPLVRIFGVEYQLNAEVAVINAFSGHADKDELLNFVEDCQPRKSIFLVHGEPEQSQALAGSLTQKGYVNYIPQKDEEVLLE